MASVVRRSGGVALQAETFGAPQLRKSLGKLFRTDPSDGGLRLGYRGKLELRSSKEVGGARLLGVGGEEDGAGEGAVTEVGDAKTFAWDLGALNQYATAAVALTRGAESLEGPQGARDTALFQLCVEYHTAGGGRRLRVAPSGCRGCSSTCRRRSCSPPLTSRPRRRSSFARPSSRPTAARRRRSC